MANKERLEDRVEHAQEEPDERSNYPGAVQETALESANKHLVQFRNELEHIDKGARETLDQRRNVLDYVTIEQEKLCESYAEAFGKIEFKDTYFEKREISQEITDTLFKGMYKQISNEQSFQTGDPSLSHPHSTRVLDSYHDTFAHALEGGSDRGPDPKLMYEAIREASDYIQNHHLQEPQIPNQEQFEEFTKTSSQHQWTEMLKIVDHTWRQSQRALEKMRQEKGPGYEATESYLTTAREAIHKYDLYDSLAVQDYGDFKETNDMAHAGAQEIIGVIQNNAGFIRLEGYEQYELPDGFKTIGEADQYLEKIKEQLSLMAGNEEAMSTMAHRVAVQITANLDGWIENAQSETNTAEDNQDEYHADYVAHAQEASVHLESAYKTALRLDFLMRPRESNDQPE